VTLDDLGDLGIKGSQIRKYRDLDSDVKIMLHRLARRPDVHGWIVIQRSCFAQGRYFLFTSD